MNLLSAIWVISEFVVNRGLARPARETEATARARRLHLPHVM